MHQFSSKKQRAIDMMIHDTENARNSILPGPYAPTQNKAKDEFWEHIRQMKNITDLPWCLIGDFNELICLNEKGGYRLHYTRFQHLSRLLFDINAESL